MKEGKILIVDDEELNRAILRDMFIDRYDILEASNGEKALKLIEEHGDSITIILLDIVMPVMDGFGLLDILSERDMLFHIPVILITGDNSKAAEKRGYDYGVADFIVKPFDKYIVRSRVKNVVELFSYKNKLEHMVDEQTAILTEQAKKLKESKNQLVDTISMIVEFRNLEAGHHIKRIKAFTKVLATEVAKQCPEYRLNDEQIESITSASAMHDVGKIVISDTILLKPGKLTNEEFDIMKSHTVKGCEIVDMVSGFEDTKYYKLSYDICRHHHERYDGRGYPDGLKGEEIPVAAQIVSIADVYEALVSERVYKKAFPKDEAFRMILEGECGSFSPKMMNCFQNVREEYEHLADTYV